MKFSTRQDIESPIEAVFDNLSNFDAYERAALKRGLGVTRRATAEGESAWDLQFPLRGKMRSVIVSLVRLERPEHLGFAGESRSFQIEATLTLIALSKARTRMGVELDIRPRTMSGRLLLQSLRLSKGGYSRKFEAGVQSFAKKIERNRFRPAG